MDDSPLARIPAELRVEIWRYAVTFDEPIPLEVKGNALHRIVPTRDLPLTILGLELTCRVLRQESRRLIFSSNAFNVKLSPINPFYSFDRDRIAAHWAIRKSALEKWFRGTGESNNNLPLSLHIDLGSWSIQHWAVQKKCAALAADTVAAFIPLLRDADVAYTMHIQVQWDNRVFHMPTTLTLSDLASTHQAEIFDACRESASSWRSNMWSDSPLSQEPERANANYVCKRALGEFVLWVLASVDRHEAAGYDPFAEEGTAERLEASWLVEYQSTH